MSNNVSTAIVTDWLVNYAGAERVLTEMLDVYPDADLFSVIDFFSQENRALINNKYANITFIQKLPRAKVSYQKYLPLMPLAIEQIDVGNYDIVLSSSHAVAKGVITGPDQLHISYVHSPIRYAWDLQHQYLREANLQAGIKSLIAKYLLHKIRMWDYRTSNGVDYFIANSKFIARRIKKVYGRDADVIYPPVNINNFTLGENKSDFYLTASRLVPYKRIDLIVEAFSQMPEKKLIVIGTGSEINKIKSKAKKNVEILGYQEDNILLEYMRKAKAFVFAAEEDFGISPVEAQACGTPVIAYGKGGSLETVRPLGVRNPSGIFFMSQNVLSIINAVEEFERKQDVFLPKDCRDHALRFSQENFKHNLKNYIDGKWNDFSEKKSIHY